MSEWQPIKTAPRDGTKIDLLVWIWDIDNEDFAEWYEQKPECSYLHGWWWGAHIELERSELPIYWRPTPAYPPKPTKNECEEIAEFFDNIPVDEPSIA